MRTSLWLVLAFAVGTRLADAGQLPDSARLHLADFVSQTDPDGLVNAVGTDIFQSYLVDRALAEGPDTLEVAQLRGDLQLGAMSGRAGATSIVARPGISEFLSAALESGAVARKSDDTSLTVSVNALLLRQLLRGEIPRGCGSLDDACRNGSGRWLRGLSGSTTFSTASSTTTVPGQNADEAAAIVDHRQLTALSLRYELLVRERNSGKAQQALEAARSELQTAAAAFLATAAPLQTRIGAIMDAGWRDETLARLRQETVLERLEDVLLRQFERLYQQIDALPDVTALRAASFEQQRAYIVAQNRLLAEKLYRKAFTLDYLHERPTAQPELHQVRVVFSTPVGRKPKAPTSAPAPPGALTINAGLSMFKPDVTPGTGWTTQDAQVSAAFDWTPMRRGLLRPTYTVAYYLQHMAANGVIRFDRTSITPGGAAIPLPRAAIEVLNTTGAIHVAQFRISLPAAQGITFPLAVSYANRSELITGRSFWQGHVGVAYDLGQLKPLLTRP
jgi:hypothetical protein